MRVDMQAVLTALRGNELLRYFREIESMEKYTLLTPPYEAADASELLGRAQELLGVRFSSAYSRFMQCCDGGLLFTNHLYSLLCPDDAGDDLVEMNRHLIREGLIPKGSAAIGETNYGAYIVQCASGRNAMGLWDSDEGQYIARYENFALWLSDALEEARFLLEEDALEEIEEFEVYIGEETRDAQTAVYEEAAAVVYREETDAAVYTEEAEAEEAEAEGEVLF